MDSANERETINKIEIDETYSRVRRTCISDCQKSRTSRFLLCRSTPRSAFPFRDSANERETINKIEIDETSDKKE